tara:strand:+ start:8159 stop:9118 length:960 start_codon:yes stop_codon:yes gene_type:complete
MNISSDKLLAFLFIPFIIFSCSDSQNTSEQIEETPCDAHFITDESLTSTNIYPGQTNENTTIAVYIIDGDAGNLTEKINIYVSYMDNTPSDGNNSIQEQFFKSISSSEFQTNEQDPKAVITVELQEIEDFLNISQPVYTPGDAFVFRLELVMTDGRIFTNNSESSEAACGSLENSDFIFEIDIFCPIDENIYTGQYTVTSVEPGVLGIPVWVVGRVVEIEIENSPISRVFNIDHLPFAGTPIFYSFTFNLLCDNIIVNSGQPTGLTCPDGNLFYGPAPNGSVAAFDPNDDSILTITFTDNELGVCEDAPRVITCTLTKN